MGCSTSSSLALRALGVGAMRGSCKWTRLVCPSRSPSRTLPARCYDAGPPGPPIPSGIRCVSWHGHAGACPPALQATILSPLTDRPSSRIVSLGPWTTARALRNRGTLGGSPSPAYSPERTSCMGGREGPPGPSPLRTAPARSSALLARRQRGPTAVAGRPSVSSLTTADHDRGAARQWPRRRGGGAARGERGRVSPACGCSSAARPGRPNPASPTRGNACRPPLP